MPPPASGPAGATMPTDDDAMVPVYPSGIGGEWDGPGGIHVENGGKPGEIVQIFFKLIYPCLSP